MTAGYLRPSVVPRPLLHRWYAWPHLIPPHTGALNLRKRCVPGLESFLKAPAVHARALENPAMFAGPFLGCGGEAAVPAARELLERTLADEDGLLALADDIDTALALLRKLADGGSLAQLHAALPPSLRGCVEPVYDTSGSPRLRFFEPLLYRAFEHCRSAQSLSVMSRPDMSEPFALTSPVLPSPDRLELSVAFDDPALDAFFAARHSAADVAELADRLGVAPADRPRFEQLFTEQAPPPHQAPDAGVRMRYFGHACVLLESRSTAVLVDPVPGYTDDGYDHFTLADLPTHLDAIVLSHAHPDHVNVEALLQLRHRTRTVVVPAGSGGDLADPDLAAMLGALGFRSVTRLDCLEEFAPGEDATITALPFTGEHADLDIRTKMVPLVRIAGRAFAFATDTAPDVPDFYDRIAAQLGPVDALFVGLECVGAPLSWLYGPLLESPPARHHDQARRLRGSDAAMADRLARQFGARRAYAYAMGFEPWLKHFTGSVYDGDSPQLSQTREFIARCDARGVPAELLDGRHERSWDAAE